MANILELKNNNRHRNPSEHRLRSTILLLCFLVAGYLGNYFKIPIILHADWLFGSLFVMLVIRLYGFGWGAIAAAIANSYTILLWKHSYAFILFTLEALFVGWRLRRHSNNLLLIDVIYWGLVGYPLLWFLYAVVGKIPPPAVLFISFKNPVNQICNALIANLILTHTPIGTIYRNSFEPSRMEAIALPRSAHPYERFLARMRIRKPILIYMKELIARY